MSIIREQKINYIFLRAEIKKMKLIKKFIKKNEINKKMKLIKK